MDEEITLLKSNQGGDNKNQALQLETESLRQQLEILGNKNKQLQDQLKSARANRPEQEENLRVELEVLIKEQLTRDFRTKEEILKKQMESVQIQKASLEGENSRLKQEFERLLTELKSKRDSDRSWIEDREQFEKEIEQLKLKIRTQSSEISSLQQKLESREKYVNYDKEGEIVFLRMKIKDLERERDNWRDQLNRLESEVIFLQGVNVQSHEISQEQFKEKIADLIKQQTGMSAKLLVMENELIQAQMDSRSL